MENTENTNQLEDAEVTLEQEDDECTMEDMASFEEDE